MCDPTQLASALKQNKDDRQQAQLKQINEQQRREQENIYIEELAELISDSFTDMSVFSVKPDKCAILQETVNQIQQINKQAESGSGDAVQQSQVSSSKPSILANDLLGPLLLEALDGFLFVVNSQGKVEFVSENITSYLKYNQDDLVGKSVYNIIHVGDHAQFSNSLLPMSLGNGIVWPGESPNSKGRNFNCRMLIKPPSEEEEDVEVKQTYVSQYESMQITAILQPYLGEKFSESRGESENHTCLMCIARRLPITEKANMMIGIEQFTTRQDLNDKIIDNDTRGLAANYGAVDFKGQNILDFCHANDVTQLRKHLQDVKKLRSHTSSVYRFKVQENRYVFVQTKSKLFMMPVTNEPDFVMSTHSIIRECDSEVELKGSASTSLMKSIIGQSNINNRGGNSSNKNLANMSTTAGMNILSDLTSFMSNPQSNIESLDLLNSNSNWDLSVGDNSFQGADFNLNAALGGSSSNVNSGGSSWDNMPQMKLAAQQPSLQSQSQNVLPTGQVLNAMAKRQANFQQHRSQSVSFDERKSPRFSPNMSGRGAPYPLQTQRSVPSMTGFNNQRSPGAAGMGGPMTPLRSPGGHFTAPFPQQQRKTVSPMMSPTTPGVSSNNSAWSQFPSPSSGEFQPVSSSVSTGQRQQNPLQVLQGIDSHPGSHDLPDAMQRPRSTDNNFFSASDMISDARTNPRVGKLCQLLTGKASFDQLTTHPSDQAAKSFLERTLSKSRSNTDITRQSPQPGPGQSPPEKPQSTSNDDPEPSHRLDGLEKKDNAILKKLLSQEEDLPTMDTEISSSPHTGGSSGDKPGIEMDKNEAEAKKPSNVLLKQLLSDDKSGDGTNKSLQVQMQRELCTPVEELGLDGDGKRPTSELLQKLLQEEEDEENCTSAPAESTIQDQEIGSGSRSRHQSGQQEPQSSGFCQPVTPQSAASFTESSHFDMLKDVYSDPSKKAEGSGMLQNRHLDNLFTKLWEKGDKVLEKDDVRIRKNKRKSSSSDVDSTEVLESDSSASARQQSQLSQKNALLAQLLSKKAAKETVVNTQLTVNPTALPQQKLPKNITEKFIQIRSTSLDQVHRPNEGASVDKESSITPNPRDNPRTNPNAPFPGNTKPDGAIGGSDNSHMGQMNAGLPATHNTDTESPNSFDQFQQFFMSQANESVSMELDANGGDSSDPLLQQILQQAADLQHELTSGNMNPSASSSQSHVPSTSSIQGHLVMSTPTTSTQVTMSQQQHPATSNSENMNVMQEIEQYMDPWEEIDNILGINSQSNTQQIGPASVTEQMAIDAIQRQLMSEEPSQAGQNQNSAPNSNHIRNINPGFPPGSVSQASSSQPGQMPSRQTLAQLHMTRTLRQQQAGGMGQVSGMDAAFTQQLQQHQQQQQQMQPPPPQGSLGQPLPGQMGPRFPQPQAPMAPLASALQGQANPQRPPMFRGHNSSTAIQVRQTLLQQQKLKQIEKQRVRQAQERQRLLQQQRMMVLQQQQQQKFGQFQQGNMGVEGHFPENLGELMNSGHAPNVTLPVQRGQAMPGPMSPRYNPSGLPGSNPPMSPMMPPSTPPSQLSPHFTQQQQWNLHPQQAGAMQGGVTLGQGGQFTGLQRHRSLSGNMPSPGGQASPRFQFPENQFPAGQQGGQLSLFPGGAQQGSAQQQQSGPQQIFAQNRLMQRQMSLPPGRGSPRTPHSPYSPDQMLMSPHSISPNSRQSQQPTQVSPGSGAFNQSQMPAGFNSASQPMSAPASFSGQSLSTATSSFNQSLPSSSQGISSQSFQQPFDLQYMETDSKKPGMPVDLNPATSNSTSQYVKQELRIICSARSEKQQLQSQQHQQQQQLQQQQQQADQLAFDTGELPLDILETINDMTKEHAAGGGGGLNLDDLGDEEDVISHSRQEAKKRLQQFRALSTGQAQYVPDDAEAKATSLFRNQLLCPPPQEQQPKPAGKPDNISQVNVVQREPRTPIDDIRPADQKNSLLQQLLSE